MAGRPAKAKGTEVLEKSKAKIKAVKKDKPVKVVASVPVVENKKPGSDPQADYLKSLQETTDPKDLLNGDVDLSGESESETKPEKTLAEEAAELMAEKIKTIEEQKEQLYNSDILSPANIYDGKSPDLISENDWDRAQEFLNKSAIMAKYEEKCNQPSDINQLLPYLRAVSDVCDHITEFGVRNPTSTYAFLAGNPKQLISYDIERTLGVAEVEAIAPNFKFVLGSTLEVEIEETDFIFIDTHHTCAQLTAELKRHSHKARKYIGFHDIFTFADRDEAPYELQPQQVYGHGPGLMAAINPFLARGEFKIDFQTYQNNGLMILKRI